MRKSEKYFKDFYEKKRDEISFIDLKKDAEIKLGEKVYKTNDILPVPIRVDSLISEIQKQSEYDGITINNIIDGMIFIFGTDMEFAYINEYKSILKTLEFKLEPYVIYNINQFDEDRNDDAVVYGKCLVNLDENEKTSFVYASTLERKAIELSGKDLPDEEKYFTDEAMKYFEKSLDYDDKFALSYYKLGFYYKNLKQYVRAKLYWEKQQKLDNDNLRVDEIRNELEALQVFVDFENGYNLVLNNKPQEGLDLLLPLVEDHSGWWKLLFFIGLAYRSLGEYKIAEKYFENVLKIDENQKETLNEYGLCMICLEKYNEAEDIFSKLLTLDPGNCEVFCNRAVALLYSGNIERAKEDIGTALKINPNDEVALNIKEELNKYN